MASTAVQSAARDSGVGSSPVGRVGVAVLTIAFALVTLFLLYALVAFWPPTETSQGAANVTRALFLGTTYEIQREQSLLLTVAIAGATGAMGYVLRSFGKYAGERNLIWSWIPSYIVAPGVGALLAIITYIVLRAGFVGVSGTTPGNPFGFAAIGLLVGLFSGQAAEKLKDVFETLLAPVPAGSDAIESRVKPVITAFDPAQGVPGDEVFLLGTGLETVTSVTFGGDVSSPASWDEAASRLTTTVPAGAVDGSLEVSVGGTVATSSRSFVVEEEDLDLEDDDELDSGPLPEVDTVVVSATPSTQPPPPASVESTPAEPLSTEPTSPEPAPSELEPPEPAPTEPTPSELEPAEPAPSELEPGSTGAQPASG